MTKEELRQLVRVLVDDKRPEYLVSDKDLDDFICEAEKEAAARAKYFRVTKKISVQVGRAAYAIDESMIFIDRARMLSGNLLMKTSIDELDFNCVDWSLTTGVPTHYWVDGKFINLYPIPKATDTLIFNGCRYPVESMETPEERHHDLAYWCAFRIFTIADQDLFSPNRAEYYLDKFRKAFGHKREALHDTLYRNKSQTALTNWNQF